MFVCFLVCLDTFPCGIPADAATLPVLLLFFLPTIPRAPPAVFSLSVFDPGRRCRGEEAPGFLNGHLILPGCATVQSQ